MNRKTILATALGVFAVLLVPTVAGADNGAEENEATQEETVIEAVPATGGDEQADSTESEASEEAEGVEPTEPESSSVAEAPATSAEQSTTEAGSSSTSVTGTGQIVLPDGTTLTFTETAQGEVTFTVSGGNGTFSGTIFVKGGPDSPGFACTFNGATTGTCHTPVNPNNGKFYGVSHIDACPGTFAAPGNPPGANTPGGGGGDRDEGKKEGGEQGGKSGRKGTDGAGSAAGAAVEAQSGEQLPFTGFPAVWLLLLGSGLVGSGAALRLSRRD